MPRSAQAISTQELKLAWSQTGTIGKQIILQHLLNIAKCGRLGSTCRESGDIEPCEELKPLQNILRAIEEDLSEPQVPNLKATVTHQVIALTALMISHCPSSNLATIALSHIHRRIDESEWSRLANVWQNSPSQARLAVYYAARVFDAVRTHHLTHFAAAVYLLKALLVLWAYSRHKEIEEGEGEAGLRLPDNRPSLMISSAVLESPVMKYWINFGKGRVKLAGVGTFTNVTGRVKLLDTSIEVMRTLRYWGIHNIYTKFLLQLRAREAVGI